MAFVNFAIRDHVALEITQLEESADFARGSGRA